MHNFKVDFTKHMPVVANQFDGGIGFVFRFLNGYGASVVQHDWSHGGKQGFWELAVVKWDSDTDWEIDYNSSVTEDVIGWLSWDSVVQKLDEIKALGRPSLLVGKTIASIEDLGRSIRADSVYKIVFTDGAVALIESNYDIEISTSAPLPF
jgi:hypothetical protein